jgi:hypothetical protein
MAVWEYYSTIQQKQVNSLQLFLCGANFFSVEGAGGYGLPDGIALRHLQ